jgi:hypothetical protein
MVRRAAAADHPKSKFKVGEESDFAHPDFEIGNSSSFEIPFLA